MEQKVSYAQRVGQVSTQLIYVFQYAPTLDEYASLRLS